MSQLFDFNQKLQLVDAAGKTLAYLQPSSEADARNELIAARAECQRLRELLAHVQQERDEYLAALARAGLSFTAEEIAEIERTGGPIEPILDKLERQAGCR